MSVTSKVLSESLPQFNMVQNNSPLATQVSAELPRTAVFPLGHSWQRRQLLRSLGGIPAAAMCVPDALTQQDGGEFGGPC